MMDTVKTVVETTGNAVVDNIATVAVTAATIAIYKLIKWIKGRVYGN